MKRKIMQGLIGWKRNSAGKHYLANSLTKYRDKFSQQIEKPYILYDGDIKEDDDNNVIYLPLYMAGLL